MVLNEEKTWVDTFPGIYTNGKKQMRWYSMFCQQGIANSNKEIIMTFPIGGENPRQWEDQMPG